MPPGLRPVRLCLPGPRGCCRPASVEALLAHPDHRPPGGWSVEGERWTEARMVARGFDVLQLGAAQREGHALAAELAARETASASHGAPRTGHKKADSC